ncbi:secreted protein C [Drosophila kikkawai]|uniref:Secreted protein C n=1 Tax=Drosophila kikkawai TaxID=30033 RepID=A0A6P4I784_DROKI|nr:cell wall integrity and stress response component 1 [Drosophila kikkawai]
MKYAVLALALFAVSAASASSAGQFLPRAFFTLDSEGHQSDVHPVNAHLLRRLRRQVVSSSSSSSSSSSGTGGSYTFSSHSVQNPDGSGQSGSSYTQQAASVPSAGVSFDSRFGEDSATGNYNPSYNNGAYNTGVNSGAYNTASNINTNAGFGSLSSSQQSYGSGAVPSTQIHQTVTTIDANGNQKVTTVHGATDQSGVLNVQKNTATYSG